MKHTAVFAFIFSLFFSCSSSSIDKQFLDAAVKDYSRHGNFIALDVKVGTAIRPCIIRGNDLFRFYIGKNDVSEEEYQLWVKSIILHQQVIVISPAEMEKYAFIVFDLPGVITKDLQKGKDSILEKYFYKDGDRHYMKAGLNEETKAEVIYALFKLNVLAKSNDESGYLYVYSYK